MRQKLKKNSNEKKKILGKIPKIYEKEISKASKKKRKKQNTQSGILAPKPVPSPLINYLGLDEDAVLTRPAVIENYTPSLKKKVCLVVTIQFWIKKLLKFLEVKMDKLLIC